MIRGRKSKALRVHRVGTALLLVTAVVCRFNSSASTLMMTEPTGTAAAIAPTMTMTEETLQMRVHGDASLPTLIYLPGVHGDWTLIGSLRARLAGKVRFVEITYPRTLDWSLDDYAAAVEDALARNGIATGTLLAESFGSQVAWTMLGREKGAGVSLEADRFKTDRLMLAGGFSHYPIAPCVRFARWILSKMSMRTLGACLRGYRRYATFRHRHARETLANIDEFIARRTLRDRDAVVHRFDLILASDPRDIVRATRIPLFALTGGIDPVVPWPLVLPWLRNHCPGLRGTKVLWLADHNVLSTDPDGSAECILDWIKKQTP